MYKKIVTVTFISLLLIVGAGFASAFTLSSWFKNIFTGNVVEGENNTPTESLAQSKLPAESSASDAIDIGCGAYELETPKDAVASSQFNNYRAANAIDDNPETHWFGDPALKYPKTIDLDLGGKRCINAVEINVFIWDIPLKLEVYVSDDGHEWRKVSDEVVLKEGAKFELIEFPETTGRYVRINELAGKRPYGALSEIKISVARQGAVSTKEEAKLTVENVFGGAGLEKYYEINGKRVYLEIDGTPVEEYFK